MIFLEDDYSEEAYAKADAESKKDGFSELCEFSARTRKKKRIYKRKKSEKGESKSDEEKEKHPSA